MYQTAHAFKLIQELAIKKLFTDRTKISISCRDVDNFFEMLTRRVSRYRILTRQVDQERENVSAREKSTHQLNEWVVSVLTQPASDYSQPPTAPVL
jgi:hypothetical protein